MGYGHNCAPRWLRGRLVDARALARPQARPVGWLVIIDRCGRRQRLPRSLNPLRVMDRIQSLGLMHALCEKTRRFEHGARRIVLFRCDNFLVVRKITILVPSSPPTRVPPPDISKQSAILHWGR
jgi:hypothetical protein